MPRGAEVAAKLFQIDPMRAAYYQRASDLSSHPTVESYQQYSNIDSTQARTREVGSTGASVASRSRHNNSLQQSLVDHGSTVTQQESDRSRNPITASTSNNCISPASRGAKGVEPTYGLLEQQETSKLNSVLRRRKKIDSTTTIDSTIRATVNSKEAKEEDYRNSCGRNNMTPSSLLHTEEYNYVEKQHKQRNTADNDEQKSNHQAQSNQEQRAIQPSTTVSFDSSSIDVTSRSDDLSHQQTIAPCNDSLPSSSASSFMSTNLRQFKTERDGNSSANNNRLANGGNAISNNNNQDNLITTAGPTTASPTEYSARRSFNHINPEETTHADILAASSINSLHQNYQQSLAASELASGNTSVPTFAHYAPANRLSGHYYNHHHQSFQASMLSQQIRIDASSGSSRNLFDEPSNVGSNSDHNAHTANHDAQSLTASRNLAQQHQGKSLASHYYDGNYNLMPTVVSKSSSPNSANSTPSPKMSMQVNTSQHANQLITSGLANPIGATQTHLNHLNHHYISSNSSTSSINHHQHQHQQVNQHYSAYGQQVTGASNQHHLIVSNHDQIYAQQQHHQQQQQQHQQQLQQQQHQQHLQQQQQQQQQSLSNQQSIYQHLANNAANVGSNHNYGSTSGAHYPSHLQSNVMSGHQSNHLMSEAHQNHLNTAAAACAAAAVVSQTLKTVVNQHGQQHQYNGSIANGFGTTTSGLMNMASQHHQHLHNVNPLGDHHFGNQSSNNQNQQQHHHQQHTSLSVTHGASIATRKYQCKMCPQVFMSKAEMKYHNQNHMREAKPYKCLQCPKAFANSSYLSQHMRIHQGVKPYTCDICSRKFTQLSHLQQHKRTHTGDKPYKCTYMNCTKQFSQLSNLQSHSRCHQLDKPYKCNSCYKCFHDEPSLLEHIPRHLESKHLKKNLCIFCGSSYQQERGLVKHFQQYHTDKTPTLVAAAIAAGTTGNTSLIASLVSSSQNNVFATPSSGSSSSSSSSSSSTCSIGSSGSINGVHNNLASIHGQSSSKYCIA